MKKWQIFIPGNEPQQIQALSFREVSGFICFFDQDSSLLAIVVPIPGLIVKPM